MPEAPEACENCGTLLDDPELCLECQGALCTPCSETPHGLCNECLSLEDDDGN